MALYNQPNLLDAMREYGCERFIFSSTAAIFGEPEYTPIDENHRTVPINAYGESKLMFEQVLERYHRAYGLRFNAFRYFNAAGAVAGLGEDHRHESHLIPIIIRCVTGRSERLQIFGNDYPTPDGTCIRDYVHVADLASAHILALNGLDAFPNRKYNLGNERGYSNLDVVRAVEAAIGKKVPFEFAPRRAGDPAVLIASSALAREELGWRPRFHDLGEIVDSAWQWHRAHPDGYARRPASKNVVK